jgi:hypothetical protein
MKILKFKKPRETKAAKALREAVFKALKDREHVIDGYALVVWCRNKDTFSSWKDGKLMMPHLIPEMAKASLAEHIINDTEEVIR